MRTWVRSLKLFVVSFLVVLVGCASEDAAPPPLPVEVASVARGQELSHGFAACGFCHSAGGKVDAPLSGGRAMDDAFGEVRGPNITLASSGIGAWTESDVRMLFRANQRPDGTKLYSGMHGGLEWISDADLTALVAYLRSIPPVDTEVERREVSFITRNTTGFFLSKPEVRGYVARISPTFRTEYGEYLVNNVAGCARCHSRPGGLFDSEEYLAGGAEVIFDGESKVAPNITSSKSAGIGSWSDDDLKRYFQSGTTPTGRRVDSRFCPVEFYARAPSPQVDAVVAYLRTVLPSE